MARYDVVIQHHGDRLRTYTVEADDKEEAQEEATEAYGEDPEFLDEGLEFLGQPITIVSITRQG